MNPSTVAWLPTSSRRVPRMVAMKGRELAGSSRGDTLRRRSSLHTVGQRLGEVLQHKVFTQLWGPAAVQVEG